MAVFDAFEAAFDFVGDIFSDVDAGDLVQAGASIGSSIITRSANRDAASRAERGSQAQADAIREGNAAAQARLDEILGRTAPGVTALQRIVAQDPSRLTPEQGLALDDARRGATTALNASGLRGAGRATVAALRDVESDFRGRAVEDNLDRRDAAARQLAGENFSTTTRSAGLDADTGRASGDSALRSSLFDANATTANARNTGQTLGDVAAIIATEEKRKGRGSKFQPKSDDDDDNRAVTFGGRV